MPQSCPPLILVCFGGGSLGGKSREIAGNPEFPAKTKKGGVRSTLLEVLCCLYSTTRGKLSFGFFPILPQFFFFFCFQFVDVVPFNPKRRTQNVMAGGVQFHHTISTLLSQRDLKKKKKKNSGKRQKKRRFVPPQHSPNTPRERGDVSPKFGGHLLGDTSSLTSSKGQRLDLDCGAHREDRAAHYDLRIFCEGVHTTRYSSHTAQRTGGIHTQHTLETHTDSAGTVLSLCLLRTPRDVSPVQARIFISWTKKYVLLVSRQTRQ